MNYLVSRIRLNVHFNDSNLFSLSLSAFTFYSMGITRWADHLNDRPSKWSVFSRGALRSVLSRSWHTIIYDGINYCRVIRRHLSVYNLVFQNFKKDFSYKTSTVLKQNLKSNGLAG